MIPGLETFRRYFADHTDKYVLIGGGACDLLFRAAGLDYRITTDLDIVLSVEVVNEELAQVFADFLKDGGYETKAKADGQRVFYRFSNPSDPTFPKMIELFARPPASISLPASDRYVRLTVEESIVSLSALLLDENYYSALKSGALVIDGVSLLHETLIIPFKARAFLDLSSRKANGDDTVKSDDIKKHKNDVFRLVQLLPLNSSVQLVEPIKDDLRKFIEAMRTEAVDPRTFKVPLTKDEAIDALVRVYDLTFTAPTPKKSNARRAPSDTRLLALLHARGGVIVATQKAIAAELGIHVRTVGASIARLLKANLIKKSRGRLALV